MAELLADAQVSVIVLPQGGEFDALHTYPSESAPFQYPIEANVMERTDYAPISVNGEVKCLLIEKNINDEIDLDDYEVAGIPLHEMFEVSDNVYAYTNTITDENGHLILHTIQWDLANNQATSCILIDYHTGLALSGGAVTQFWSTMKNESQAELFFSYFNENHLAGEDLGHAQDNIKNELGF